jgi:hypothetical protein
LATITKFLFIPDDRFEKPLQGSRCDSLLQRDRFGFFLCTKVWFDYPRWTKGGSAIVYHAGGKLFLDTLADSSTKQVSTDDKADHRDPHGEATPN